MQNTKILATLSLLLFAPVTLPAYGQSDAETYQADWNGVPFMEYHDPLKRFEHFDLVDADGDGFPELDPVLNTVPGHENVSRQGISNVQISLEMVRHGISDADIQAQFHLMLGFHADWADELSQASDYISQGLYREAVDFLLGSSTDGGEIPNSPLTIHYECGVASNFGDINVMEWVIGVPAPMDCAYSTNEVDQSILSMVSSVSTVGADVDGVNMDVTFITLNENDHYSVIRGANYRDQHLGIHSGAEILRPIQIEVDLAGFTTTTVEGDVWFRSTNGNFEVDDAIVYSTGSWQMYRGKTIILGIQSLFSEYHVKIQILATSSTDWLAHIWLDSESYFDDIKLYLQFSGGKELRGIIGTGFPSEFSVSFYRVTTGPFAKDLVQIKSYDGPLLSFEFMGSLFLSGTGHLTLAIVGLPERNSLLLNMAAEADGVAPNTVDLARSEPTWSGDNARYRAVTASGHVKNKAISILGTDLMRGRVAFAKEDFADSDKDVMAETGAHFATSSGKLLLNSQGEKWYKKLDSDFEYRTQDEYRYNVGPFPTCTVACSGNVPPGQWEKNDSVGFNGYYYAFGRDDFDFTLCAAKWAGVCP